MTGRKWGFPGNWKKKLKFDDAQTRICRRRVDTKNSLRFWDHPIQTRRPDLVLINKKKKTYHFVEFAVIADHEVKIKESDKTR